MDMLRTTREILSVRRERLDWQRYSLATLPLVVAVLAIRPSVSAAFGIAVAARWIAAALLAGLVLYLALKRAHDLGKNGVWLGVWLAVLAATWLVAGSDIYLLSFHPWWPKLVSLAVATGMLASLYQLLFKLSFFAGDPAGNRYGAPEEPLSTMEALNERYPFLHFAVRPSAAPERPASHIKARIEATRERSTKAPGRVENAPAAERIGMALRRR